MKICILVAVLILAVNVACVADDRTLGSAITNLPVPADVRGHEWLHEFRSREGKMLAHLYGLPRVPGVYFELLIVTEQADARFVSYLLDRDRFLGLNGIEQEPDSSEFHGYRIVVKGSDYIVVNYLSSDGRNVSDDVTIAWNEASRRFEFEKTP